MPDSITVTGYGAAAGTPDVVVLRAGAEVRHESPGPAFAAVNAALSAMLAAVRAAGVSPADIQTKNASLQSHWYDEQKTRVHRFQARQDFTAQLRDIGTAGDIVGSVIAAGGEAARLHGMSLGFSDVEELSRSARRAAWEDARAKAEQYAQLAGRALGPVQRIAPGRGAAFVRREPASTGQVDMAVEAGESEITATVEVEWALVD